MSLFKRPIDFTTLFNTRKDNRTNLFFTPDQAGPNPNDSTIDATMTINGYNVTVSGLDYTYVETSRTNDTGATLYYAQGTFSSPADLIINGTAYASLPGTKTAPFTNPDPVPNPIESTVTQTHDNLYNQTFSACLWKQSDNTTSILYSVQKDLSVGGDYNDAILSVKTFDSVTNQVTLQLKVDTTYDYFWHNIQNAITSFDWNTNKFSSILFQSTTGLYTYTENANAGGQTAPFDQRYSISFTDTTPYYSGNFVIWEWTHQVVSYDNLVNFVGNGLFTLTNSGGLTYANSKAITITDSIVPWIGVVSFTVTNTQANVTKSYAEWTNDYLFKQTHGGTTTTYTITGGASVIDFATLGITANNNDVFEIVQPISGTNISLTYTKSISVAYTGTPPNDWTVTVTTVGYNFPVTFDIDDVSNNSLDHIEITQSPQVFDIRTLPLETTTHGHPHVDWYGFGTVYFKNGSVVDSFDASYVAEADGDKLSGAVINGFDVTITNNPYTFTYSDTSKEYEGDSYTAFNRFGNDYTYTDMFDITKGRNEYDESFQHEYTSTYPIQKVSTNSTGTEIYWSFNVLNQAIVASATLATADRLDTMGTVTYTNYTNSATNIMSVFVWDNTQTNGYFAGYNSSTLKNVIEKWTGGSLVSTWTMTTNYGGSATVTDIVVSGTDLLVLQIDGTINKYDITTFPPSNTPTQTDTVLGSDSGYVYPNKECVSLQLISGSIALATILTGQTPPIDFNDNFYSHTTISGTDLTTYGTIYEVPHDNRTFRSVWLRTVSGGSSFVAKDDYIYYEADQGSRHNVLSKTFNINQPQQYQSGTNYTVETNIPFLHPLFFAYLADTTPDYGSLYTFSEQVTVSKSFDIGDTYLNAYITSASFSNGNVALKLIINTAQNNVWRRLTDAKIRADYNATKMTLAGFTGANGYNNTTSVSTGTPPYEKFMNITHSVNGLAGGDFEVGDILFEFTEDVTQADINGLVIDELFDSSSYWKYNLAITPINFNITWQGITLVDTFTSTSFQVTKTVSDAFNFTYSINGGASVSVTGAVGTTQVVSASLSNGDTLVVNQPYFGTAITVTVSGIVVLTPPTPISNYDTAYASFNWGNATTKETIVSDDGEYVVRVDQDGTSGRRLEAYQLSTNWDVSTKGSLIQGNFEVYAGTIDTYTLVGILDPSATDYGMLFYTLMTDYRTLEYNLGGSPFDLTTISVTANGWRQTNSALAGAGIPYFADFYDSGNKFVIYNSSKNQLQLFNLSTAYRLTSSSWSRSSPNTTISNFKTVAGVSGDPTSISWVTSGKYCYIMTSVGNVYLYDTTASTYDYSQLTSANIIASDTSTYVTGSTEVTLKFDPTGVLSSNSLGIYTYGDITNTTEVL